MRSIQIGHLKSFMRNNFNRTRAETLDQECVFETHVQRGQKFKITVIPESTGDARVISEANLGGYVDQYNKMGGSLRPGDYSGHHSSYVCRFFYDYLNHLPSCNCFPPMKPE